MFGNGVLPAAQRAAVLSLFILLLLMAAKAQANAQDLLGYWRLDGDSVFIQVVETEAGLEASVIRSDWAPGQVGHKMFEALRYDAEENVWLGIANSLEGDGPIDVQIKLRRKNVEFKVRNTSGPRLRMKWKWADKEEFN